MFLFFFLCNPCLIPKKIHPPFDFRENSSSFDFRENPFKTPKENQKNCFSFAPCVFWICSRGLFAFMRMDLNFTNPNSRIFEKYRQNFSIFQTLPAIMGTAAGDGGLSGRRRGFAAFWGRAFQRAGAAACRTTLQ